ncbi:MAG: hypothetical protein ABSE84_15910, partial [Isosphaeraceae bacterium]
TNNQQPGTNHGANHRSKPPGRYVLHGQPNPSTGNQQTKPLTIDLKGGRLTEITISAASRAN